MIVHRFGIFGQVTCLPVQRRPFMHGGERLPAWIDAA